MAQDDEAPKPPPPPKYTFDPLKVANRASSHRTDRHRSPTELIDLLARPRTTDVSAAHPVALALVGVLTGAVLATWLSEDRSATRARSGSTTTKSSPPPIPGAVAPSGGPP